MASSQYHVRSTSLPSRSHPSTLRIEEELNKFRSWDATSTSRSESISAGLSGLVELYKCIDDLVNLASTQQAFSHIQQHEKCVEVDEILDASVKLLDICSITRDTLLQIKEHAQALQSALRRRKGDLSIETNINKYICFRKKMKKDAKKLMAALNQIETKFGALPIRGLDHPPSAAIRVLREVSLMNISIFQSLVLLLSVPVSKPKPSRWSLVSKLMHKGTVTCEEKQEDVNELETVDAALHTLCRYTSSDDVEKTQIAHKRLQALEISIEGLENSLECVFRRLIKTRASILNILSQ